MGLNTLQQQAFEMIFNNPVSILTGGPGTGKTFTLSNVIDGFEQTGKSFKMAAPTGKAAKKMEEATGQPACTIHRLLEPKPRTDPISGNVNFSFNKNHENPIDADILILDECSMITNSLMADTLDAIATGTKLVLVGDKGQLPSVGAGAVFRDMIGSKRIPVTELTEIQRNSGDIVKACKAISEGKFYNPSDKLDPDAGKNLKHVEASATLIIQNIIKTIVCDRMVKRGYDPIWDCQVISPVNKRTDLSCQDLNKVLQDKLNPNPVIEGSIFRVGDKVIQTKNEKIQTPIGLDELVVNGDIGKIFDIEKNNMTVKFFNPDRTVLIPLKKNHLLLAYTITCHRFQGSEAPVIVIPVHSAFGFFLDRSWIYTAISRAEQICITVGEFQAIRVATMKDNSNKRITKLRELLEGF